MRGTDETTGSLFSYVDLEERVPARHALRKVREIVNDALASMDADFDWLHAKEGRRSIAPERLLRASLIQMLFSVRLLRASPIQMLFSVRSERQLMEQMQYNLLFRWFVGLGVDDPVWVPTVFSKNRDRLLTTDIARKFLAAILAHAQVAPLLSDEHFSVDGTLIKAWASMKSFQLHAIERCLLTIYLRLFLQRSPTERSAESEMTIHTSVEAAEGSFINQYLHSLALLERLHRLLLDVIKDEFERLGILEINAVQALLLFNIGDKEVTAGELRTRGYYQGSNVSYNLKKLVEIGYMHHQRCEIDRRSVRIRLTPKGRSVHETLAQLFARHADGLQSRGFVSATSVDELSTTLRRVERYWTEQIRYIY